MDFNQVIPSYEVATEFSKGKEKTWYSNLAAKYLSHAKNKLTNSHLKYPTSRKVLFGTERLLGKTWVRLWFGNGKRIYLEHSHQQSTNYSILPYQNLLYHLYHTILQHSQHPNFYFPILLIKIIFLHNKIIYPKITIIYNTTHYLLYLSHSFYSTTTTTFTETTITTNPPLLHYTHLTPPPPATHNLPSTPKKKKKKATHSGKPRPKPMASPNPHPWQQTHPHTRCECSYEMMFLFFFLENNSYIF